MAERELTWRKASRSGRNGGNCVEVAALPDQVLVRDSKDPAGGRLAVSPAGLGLLPRLPPGTPAVATSPIAVAAYLKTAMI